MSNDEKLEITVFSSGITVSKEELIEKVTATLHYEFCDCRDGYDCPPTFENYAKIAVEVMFKEIWDI